MADMICEYNNYYPERIFFHFFFHFFPVVGFDLKITSAPRRRGMRADHAYYTAARCEQNIIRKSKTDEK